MSKINIAGLTESTDVHYRYKMNKLDVVSEKGKTVIKNLDKVSNDIKRDQGMIIFFFKRYFGASFTLKDAKYSTAKKVSANEFQDALKEFIEYSVLCPTCKLPETHLSATKTDVTITCDCCGHNDKVNLNTIVSKPMRDLYDHMMKN
jgi:translation initiation factor 2 beta subunit (eIF-2beta)/eIF-5